MRILLDTNILILRENNHIIPENVVQMMRLANGITGTTLHVHPLSINEIRKDGNLSRRDVNLSKVNSYAILEAYPNYMDDVHFKNIIGAEKTENDIVDNQLLYCVYKNVVDYLITEDHEILNKADLLGLNTVINSNEAIEVFEQYYPKSDINLIQSFIKDKAFNFDLSDDIFDSLKQEYKEFSDWWSKIANRDVYAYKSDEGRINALLIPKIEIDEVVDCTPSLSYKKVLKICLFKVADHAQGLKLGERLLRTAFDYAIANSVEDIYLTHFCKEKDYLVFLIEKFGFYKYGENSRGEGIFIKRIVKAKQEDNKEHSILNRIYYPSFCFDQQNKTHIVPIIPAYHKKLFPDYVPTTSQKSLFRDTSSEGNSIKKAYICNSNTTKIKPNDILLFYRTHDYMSLTTLGVVESVYYKQRDPNEILKLIAKRTVFSYEDIAKLCESDVLVILFNQNFHLNNDFSYSELCNNKIIKGPIQTITEIKQEDSYKIIQGNIDERFIIN